MTNLKPLEQEVLRHIQKQCSEVAGVETNLVQPHADFQEDLGVSSEEMLHILISLEKEYDISIPVNLKREFLQGESGTTVMDMIILIAEELE
jgi:acyl carrier protein